MSKKWAWPQILRQQSYNRTSLWKFATGLTKNMVYWEPVLYVKVHVHSSYIVTVQNLNLLWDQHCSGCTVPNCCNNRAIAMKFWVVRETAITHVGVALAFRYAFRKNARGNISRNFLDFRTSSEHFQCILEVRVSYFKCKKARLIMVLW